ncbi:MAG: condensation domain-containing protein, partial [Blastocatellia bacterium]
MESDLAYEIKALGQRLGVTLFMTLLAAFEVLLYRYSGQKDILVGTPIAGRNRKEVEGLIGIFVNTLVTRTDMSGDPTFRDLLDRVKEDALGAYANQDLPFEHLVEELQPERDLSRSPLFQVLFVLQNAPVPSLRMGDVKLTPMVIESESSKFDMTLAVMEQKDDTLSGWLEYNASLFDDPMISQMAVHYKNILKIVAGNPDKHLSDIQMLTEPEVRRLCFEWNDTYLDQPARRLHDRFQEQARQTGDAIAVLFGMHHISYSKMNQRANQLAGHMRAIGVGRAIRVGVCAERTPEMIASLIAVLKAGGSYVPLDPAYPKERLAYLLDDSQANVLLT